MNSTPITYEEQFIRDLAMSLEARVIDKPIPVRATPVLRAYAAGQIDRLTYSFGATMQSANQIIRTTLWEMRGRSRTLGMNNPYVRKFFKSLVINCIGENGIALQCQAKGPDGKFDVAGNKLVESSFSEWGREGNCDVTGKLSIVDFLALALECIARDGEVLIRKRKGWTGNKWRYSLQLIEADHLWEQYNVMELPNGNKIVMSVEVNPDGRPVAYHLLKKHPGDSFWGVNMERVRIPAEEIEHVYIVERVNQNRGVPWIYASMLELHRIGEFRAAAIVNAQVGASKMGIWESADLNDPLPGTGSSVDAVKGMATGKDEKGNYVQDAVPGAFDFAPAGYKLVKFDPTYPNNEFGPFNKTMLHGACAGMLSAYATITGDLESVTFSSIRSGKIDEREMYRFITWWFIRKTLDKFIYSDWLELSLLSGALIFPSGKALPPSVFSKFNKPKWGPRGFDWVDPLKDIESTILEIDNKLSTRTIAVAERHGSNMTFRDICEQLAEEETVMEEFGLNPADPKTGATFKQLLSSGTDGEGDTGTNQQTTGGNE